MCVNNNYPYNIVDKHIKNFINKKINKQKETEKNHFNTVYVIKTKYTLNTKSKKR